MSVYFVGAVTVRDREKYLEYISVGLEISEQCGAEFLAYGKPNVVEGFSPGERLAIIRFPDQAAFDRFYNSPEYSSVIPIRHANAHTSFILTLDDEQFAESMDLKDYKS